MNTGDTHTTARGIVVTKLKDGLWRVKSGRGRVEVVLKSRAFNEYFGSPKAIEAVLEAEAAVEVKP